jgi:MoxR-like ATPase
MSNKKLIPAKDKLFVPWGNYDSIEGIVSREIFYPAYLTGPSGCGKSLMVEQACAKTGRPLIRINFYNMTEEDQLIGTKTLFDGNIEIVEGPVIYAMRNGAVLLLDEYDCGQANTLLCLQPILEGKPYYFKLKNEIVHPEKGFQIFATGNTKGRGSDDGKFIGTNILNEANLERFGETIEFDFPPPRTELMIILRLMEDLGCENKEFAGDLVKWADVIRRTHKNNEGIEDVITTRRLVHIVRRYSMFPDTIECVTRCCSRFDSHTKDAFINLFTKVSADPILKEKEIDAEVVPF